MTFAPFGHQRESLPPLILWSPFSLGTAASHRHANSPKPGLLVSSAFLVAPGPSAFCSRLLGGTSQDLTARPPHYRLEAQGAPGPLLQPEQPNGP